MSTSDMAHADDPDVERVRYQHEAAERVRTKIAAGRASLAAYIAGVSAAIEPGGRQEDTIATLVAAGIERALAGAPIVRRGDVALTLTWELQNLIAQWKDRGALLARVEAALGSDEAWAALRDELRALPKETP